MKIKEYQLQEIIIGYDSLKGIIDTHGEDSVTYKEKELARNSCIAWLSIFIAGLFEVITDFELKWTTIISAIITVVFFSLMIVSGVKWKEK